MSVVAQFSETHVRRLSNLSDGGFGLPGLYEMGDGKDNAEDDTQSSDHDIGDAEEVVLAAHDRPCGNQERLCAAIFFDGKD